ncbi:MAG: hypothetical protein LBD41_03645 [Clostridiales Family XIII bacterium]|jgi:hypothetical protein|nr:hypothetical protein [Clostridiales Family XIII bacterium]
MLSVLSIEELLPLEVEKAIEYLNLNAIKSPISGLFWRELPYEFLTKEQKNYLEQGGELKVAIEVKKNSIRVELLVRSESLTNEGGGKLTKIQLEYILLFTDKILDYMTR